MALQVRRGTNAERQTITPQEGELLYTTDTKNIFVGDGSTAGGNPVLGINSIIDDSSPQLGGPLDLNGQNITGTGNIDIDGTITATGNINLGDNSADNIIASAPSYIAVFGHSGSHAPQLIHSSVMIMAIIIFFI